MSNELIVIEEGTALQVLTSDDQVQKLIDEVQFKVDNLDGGTMETGVGRKKIISNANKAKKSKTALNKIIDDLINQAKDSIEEKTKAENAQISALKLSKSKLGEGLDNIYKNTRQKVTDFEDELKRVKAEAEAKALKVEIDNAHELGLFMDADFNKELAIKQKEESDRIAENQRIRDDEIAKKAAEDAKAKAEKDAKDEKDRLEREKLQLIIDGMYSEALLINRDIDDKAKEIKDAADKKAAKELADKNAKLAADKARQDEIDRQVNEKKIEDDRKAKLAADREHAGKIHSQMVAAFVQSGYDEEGAKQAVTLIAQGLIPNCSIQY